MAKIKEEELELIISQQQKSDDFMKNLGLLEAKKHELLHSFARLNGEMADTRRDLEESYGNININLQTGEYTKIEEDAQGS